MTESTLGYTFNGAAVAAGDMTAGDRYIRREFTTTITMRNHAQLSASMMERPMKNKQQGAVLAVSLIMLLVMTLLGISSLQGTTIEEKMAGNLMDRIRSFEAAESALREGEEQLAAATAPSVSAYGWLHESEQSIGWGSIIPVD